MSFSVPSVDPSTFQFPNPVRAQLASDLGDPAQVEGAAIAKAYKVSVSVLAYGAKGDGATDDKAAIDAALAATSSGGVVVFPGGYSYSTSGGHVVPKGVSVSASGATILHTGNNVCFNFNSSGSLNTVPTGIMGLNLSGNAGTTACGVELGNSYGAFVHRSTVVGYTAGVGLRLNNVSNWTEGTNIDGLYMDHNQIGIQFTRSTGTDSFAYTRVNDASINVYAGGSGIDLGSTASALVYLYNADLRAALWLHDPAAVGFLIGATASSDNCRIYITGELIGSASGALGVKNLGGTIKGFGHFNVKGSASDVSLGQTRILAQGTLVDSKSGVDSTAGDTFTTAIAQNVDTPWNAGFGYITGSSRSIPFASGYDQSDVFRVYKVPNNGVPSAGTAMFRVRNDGGLAFGVGTAGRIQAGTGAPTVSATFGAIYIRTDDPSGLPVAYVKTTSSGTGGWQPLDYRRADITANRPSLPAGQQRGLAFYDTTLGKPIWWNGSAWTDATGTAV